MKKIFAIAIVSLFLLHYAGFYAYFGARLMSIRYDMKNKLKELPEEKLERIVLSKNDFAKIDFDEDEVELNGKMYDIAKVIERGDQFIIHALHDASEDNLLSFLDEMVKRSGNDEKPVPSQLLQFLSLVFIPSSNNFFFGQTAIEKHFSLYANLYSSFRSSIESPPPKG
jgi:hypothetical protein